MAQRTNIWIDPTRNLQGDWAAIRQAEVRIRDMAVRRSIRRNRSAQPTPYAQLVRARNSGDNRNLVMVARRFNKLEIMAAAKALVAKRAAEIKAGSTRPALSFKATLARVQGWHNQPFPFSA